jgi:hypothetical protein
LNNCQIISINYNGLIMVTFRDIGVAIWLLFGITIIAILLFLISFLLLHAALWLLRADRRLAQAVVHSAGNALPLALVGMVAGFLTGASRQPAVQALVPAVLTLVGIIFVYLIGRSRVQAPAAGFAVSVFALALLAGTAVGVTARVRDQELTTSIQVLKAKSDRELVVRLYREALGLPSEMPEFGKKDEDKDIKE